MVNILKGGRIILLLLLPFLGHSQMLWEADLKAHTGLWFVDSNYGRESGPDAGVELMLRKKEYFVTVKTSYVEYFGRDRFGGEKRKFLKGSLGFGLDLNDVYLGVNFGSFFNSQSHPFASTSGSVRVAGLKNWYLWLDGELGYSLVDLSKPRRGDRVEGHTFATISLSIGYAWNNK